MNYTLDKIISSTELLANKIININKITSTLLTNALCDEIIKRMKNILNRIAPPQPLKIAFGNMIRYARLYYKNEFLMVYWLSYALCHIGRIFHGVTYQNDDLTTGVYLLYLNVEDVNLKEYTITLSNNSTIKVITSGSVQTFNPLPLSLTIEIYNADTNLLLATPNRDGDVFLCLPNTNYIILFIAQ